VAARDDGSGFFITRTEGGEAIVGFGVDLAKCADNAVDPRGGLNEWPCL